MEYSKTNPRDEQMSFETDLKLADKFEVGLMDYARHFKNVQKVEDVRDIKIYQSKDIDFIIKYDDKISLIEAKIDFFNTPNFYLETISNKNYSTTGCILKSKSDEIWYYCVLQHKLYIFPTKKLQEFLESKTHELTDGGDNAKGLKIRKGDLYKSVRYRTEEVYI